MCGYFSQFLKTKTKPSLSWHALEAFEAMSILQIRDVDHWRVAYVFNLCILSGFTLPEFFNFNHVCLFARTLIRADLFRSLVNTDPAPPWLLSGLSLLKPDTLRQSHVKWCPAIPSSFLVPLKPSTSSPPNYYEAFLKAVQLKPVGSRSFDCFFQFPTS